MTEALEPTPERRRVSPVERAEPERKGRSGARQILDAHGRPGSPWKTVDTLTALERAGTITHPQRAAGERYRDDYELMLRSALKAHDIASATGSGVKGVPGPLVSDRMIAASRRYESARQSLVPLLRISKRAIDPIELARVVICEGASITQFRTIVRCRRETISQCLADILATLERHYWRR